MTEKLRPLVRSGSLVGRGDECALLCPGAATGAHQVNRTRVTDAMLGFLRVAAMGQIGPITCEADRHGLGKGGVDISVDGSPKIGGGSEAKVAGKGCYQGKW